MPECSSTSAVHALLFLLSSLWGIKHRYVKHNQLLRALPFTEVSRASKHLSSSPIHMKQHSFSVVQVHFHEWLKFFIPSPFKIKPKRTALLFQNFF